MTISMVLRRDDLLDSEKNLSKDMINLSCFNVPRMFIQLAHDIHFHDDDGSVKVLKLKDEIVC